LTDQPSAAEPARRSRTDRGDDAARRRATARWRAAIAVVVLALLTIGGFLLFGGNVPLIDDGSGAPGEFGFELLSVQASATSHTQPSQLRDTVQEAGAGVKATMDELYFRAFVDTGSWGDYRAAYELFDGQAAARAEADAEVLTLGPTANDDFEALNPTTRTLSIAVLTDLKDVPATAIAEVRFSADAQRTDDTATQISSNGSFFLRRVDGAWRIFAYRVDRDDRAVAAPSPTGSPS
jgi:hypothetical protein